MGKKMGYTIESIRSDAESYGFKLISNEINNSREKLEFECKNGHRFNTAYYNFKRVHGCLECSNRKKLSYEYVNDFISSHGYTLLSHKYINARAKLSIKCPENHEYEVPFHCFKQGQRCSKCVGGVRHDLAYVKEQFVQRGYTPLFDSYKNASKRLPYICPNHPDQISYIRYDSLNQGHGCKACAVESRSGENASNWKGGITPLIAYIRENYLVEWRKKSMKTYGFECFLEKTSNKLAIHHMYKGFTEILKESLDLLNIPVRDKIKEYSPDELKQIGDKCTELHECYGLGIPLETTVHRKFHHEYGYGNNTYDQFKEFAEKYYKINIDAYIVDIK